MLTLSSAIGSLGVQVSVEGGPPCPATTQPNTRHCSIENDSLVRESQSQLPRRVAEVGRHAKRTALLVLPFRVHFDNAPDCHYSVQSVAASLHAHNPATQAQTVTCPSHDAIRRPTPPHMLYGFPSQGVLTLKGVGRSHGNADRACRSNGPRGIERGVNGDSLTGCCCLCCDDSTQLVCYVHVHDHTDPYMQINELRPVNGDNVCRMFRNTSH